MLRLWRHCGRRRQIQFAGLLGLVLVSAFAEVISLGALLPFLGILTSPDRLFANPFVHDMAGRLGITAAAQLLWPFTIAFALAAVMAGAIRMLMLWVSTQLAFAVGADLSIDVYRRTLFQPYSVHVARNSSEIISGVSTKVGAAINVLYQALLLISSFVLLTAITATLIIIDPAVALLSSLGFGMGYGFISTVSRRRLDRNSQFIATEQTRVIKILQEGLGGIRDVLMDGTQEVYCAAYSNADVKLRKAQGDTHFIVGSPRFAMEALGMVLIAALAYWLSQQPGGLVVALPVLGALALGTQRLLPALQQCFAAWASIVGSRASLADALDLLDQPPPVEAHQPPRLPFRTAIQFRGVSFRYTDSGPWVLENLEFEVPKGARVGFIGSTGSGKSTALDLLMGLLSPTEGEILVDGQPVTGSSVNAWQRTIAHVPQSIYLADSSLAENIALGVPRGKIDLHLVRRAASQAQIADFIERMPNSYNASVGERGVRLSGGQRQRIGIARALYKQAQVIIFDEATSALDNETEQAVMDAIGGLHDDLTILIIAHRLTTLRNCTHIVELENSRIKRIGSYEKIVNSSKTITK